MNQKNLRYPQDQVAYQGYQQQTSTQASQQQFGYQQVPSQATDNSQLYANQNYNQQYDNSAGYQQQQQQQYDGYGQTNARANVVTSSQSQRQANQPYQSSSQQTPAGSSGAAQQAYFQQTTQMQGQTQQIPQSTLNLEEFNSDKSVMRVTTDRIPNTNALQKEIALPIGIIVKPYGEPITGEEVASVTFGQKPIVRCKDCRAYVNPFVRFIENGQKWICNFCGDINPTDNYYYSPLTSMGLRQDYEDRTELKKGSVDFIASNEYMNRPPMPPTYIFVLDVSKPAIDTGYLNICCSTIKSIIEQQILPGSERTRISFITYDAAVHFYNLRSTLKQPQMLVVSEIDPMYLPQPDDLLVNLSDSYDLVISLLDTLPQFFAKTQVIDTCFVAALQAANLVASPIGARMLFFQVSNSIIKHPMLQPKQLANTAERIDLVNSTNPYFANTGSELAHMQISCDLFIFTHGKNQYKNMSTFSDLARKSSGNLYYYPEFSLRTLGMKFSNELYHCLTRKMAWEAVFRIRTSTGYNQIQSYGNIQIKAKTTDLVLCPTIDVDRVLVYEIEKNDLINEDANRIARRDTSHLYIQSALLFSTSEGERRIRVHNLAIPLTNMKHLPFEYLDITAMSHYFARLALNRLQTNVNFQVCRGMVEMYLTNLCRSMLKSQQTIQKQHVPDNMQYLAMYVLGLLKQQFLSPTKQIVQGEHLDQLNYLRFVINSMSPEETLPIFSPQIISIHNHELNDQEFPPLEPLDRISLRTDNLYLCFNGLAIYFYVGRQCDPWFLQQVFKVSDISYVDRQISEEEMFAGYEESQYLTALYNIINQFRYQRQPFCELRVLTEGDPDSEIIIKTLMITDNQNPTYNMDFTKFLATITGGGPIGPGVGGGTAAAAYY